MIVDEPHINARPVSTCNRGTTIGNILKIIGNSAPHFKTAIANPLILKPINENKYTQVLIEQINTQLIKAGYTFLANAQYSELFLKVKGIPDFYFYFLEEGSTTSAIMVAESKILPAPSTKRVKEYVIGATNNGGIERFKSKKHGDGLPEAALVAFVLENDYTDWHTTVNSWITDLSVADHFWKKEEQLNKLATHAHFSYATSQAFTIADPVKLHHFWISLS
jgi:hypothetical protein